MRRGLPGMSSVTVLPQLAEVQILDAGRVVDLAAPLAALAGVVVEQALGRDIDAGAGLGGVGDLEVGWKP